VGNALLMDGENDRVTNLRGDPIPGKGKKEGGA
jgi:hypothetical protein